jgi:hypothetical protein
MHYIMNTFQKTVMGIALVLLLITLGIVWISISNSKYSKKFPPVVAECPDYWLREKKLCVNKKQLGNGNCHGSMDFTNSAQWDGNEGICNKQKWAKGCNLTWDGVTNNVHACK